MKEKAAHPVSTLKVHLNPVAEDKIHAELTNFGPREKVRLTLLDVTGRKIKAMNVVTDEQGSVSTDMLLERYGVRGIYILKAQSRSGGEQLKLIIK